MGNTTYQSKPRDEHDTLLILPVSFTSTGGAQWGFYYKLEFEGPLQMFSVFVNPTMQHFVAVSSIPAGTYNWKTITVVPLATGYRTEGGKTYDAPAVAVSTREGTATLAPFCFDVFMKEVSPHQFQQSFQPRKVQDADITVISKALQGTRGFSDWIKGFSRRPAENQTNPSRVCRGGFRLLTPFYLLSFRAKVYPVVPQL
jgi:hypothetical protein